MNKVISFLVVYIFSFQNLIFSAVGTFSLDTDTPISDAGSAPALSITIDKSADPSQIPGQPAPTLDSPKGPPSPFLGALAISAHFTASRDLNHVNPNEEQLSARAARAAMTQMMSRRAKGDEKTHEPVTRETILGFFRLKFRDSDSAIWTAIHQAYNEQNPADRKDPAVNSYCPEAVEDLYNYYHLVLADNPTEEAAILREIVAKVRQAVFIVKCLQLQKAIRGYELKIIAPDHRGDMPPIRMYAAVIAHVHTRNSSDVDPNAAAHVNGEGGLNTEKARQLIARGIGPYDLPVDEWEDAYSLGVGRKEPTCSECMECLCCCCCTSWWQRVKSWCCCRSTQVQPQ